MRRKGGREGEEQRCQIIVYSPHCLHPFQASNYRPHTNDDRKWKLAWTLVYLCLFVCFIIDIGQKTTNMQRGKYDNLATVEKSKAVESLVVKGKREEEGLHEGRGRGERGRVK